nr:transporter substrate-binding domain-containing protein [Thalassotalea piscium]
MLFSSSIYGESVTLGTGVNADPPFVYGEGNIISTKPGLTIELFKLIEKKFGIEIIIVKRPWARVLNEIKANELDGGFHFSFNKKRIPFYAFPINKKQDLPSKEFSLSQRVDTLYTLKGAEIHWNGETLVNSTSELLNVAVIRGGAISHKLKQKHLKLYQVSNDTQLLKLLLSRRVDAIIGLENMVDAKIQQLEVNQQSIIEKSSAISKVEPYYLVFSKKFYQEKPETAWKIWEAIELIKQSEEYLRIVESY